MLSQEIKDLLENCALEIDVLLTKNKLIIKDKPNNLDILLKEISEYLKKEIKWFAIEVPRIAKERNYSLEWKAQPEVPEGYEKRNESLGGGFELWKKAKGQEPEKLICPILSIQMTRKKILREICEFEEEKQSS